MPRRVGDRAQGRPGTRAKGFDERQLPARDADRIDDAGRSARGGASPASCWRDQAGGDRDRTLPAEKVEQDEFALARRLAGV